MNNIHTFTDKMFTAEILYIVVMYYNRRIRWQTGPDGQRKKSITGLRALRPLAAFNNIKYNNNISRFDNANKQ